MRELPEGWAVCKMPEAVFFQEGPGLRKYQYTESGIPFLNIRTIFNGRIHIDRCQFLSKNEVDEKYQHFLLNAGDIICSTSGTLGKTAIVQSQDLPLLLNTSVMRFRSLDEKTVIQGYIHLYLKSDLFLSQAKKASTGSAQVNVGPSHLKEFEFPLPPLNEQKRIADRLDQLLTRIDKTKAHLDRIPPLLKRFRQSVLAAATSGTLTEEWREEYVIEKLGLNSIAELKLNDDYLFDLPAGWKWVKLTDIANYKSGVAFKSNEFSNSGTQVIRLGNVYQGKLDLSRDPIFMKVVPDKVTTLRSKSIVVSQTGTRHKRDYGYFVMIPEDAPPLLLNQRLLAIMTSPATIAKYVVLASNTIAYKEFFFSQETGGVNQGNVGIAGVMQGPIPLPPIEEQQEIVRRVEALFTKADRIEAQYKNARQQVDRLTPALLAKAFRGELVPQDPNDEPASVLLERVKEARSAPQPAKAKRKAVK